MINDELRSIENNINKYILPRTSIIHLSFTYLSKKVVIKKQLSLYLCFGTIQVRKFTTR